MNFYVNCVLRCFNFAEILDEMVDIQREFGGVVKLQTLFYYALMITDYKFLEFLFNGNKILDKSDEYSFFTRWLGTGLLTSGRKYNCVIDLSFLINDVNFYWEIVDLKKDENCGHIWFTSANTTKYKCNVFEQFVTYVRLTFKMYLTRQLNAYETKNIDFHLSLKRLM